MHSWVLFTSLENLCGVNILHKMDRKPVAWAGKTVVCSGNVAVLQLEEKLKCFKKSYLSGSDYVGAWN